MKRPPDKMFDGALFYVERFGWTSFPVPPGTKRSYLKGANSKNHRRWGADNDPEILRGYFRRWPRANLGIPTGAENGFWVLEADTPKGHSVDGIASLRALERRYGRLPKTLMAISPSGSLHYYFNWPTRGRTICNSASRVAPGIDTRGEGGMVLAPPSIKPGVGAYRFLNWGTPIVAAPAWLLKLVARKPRKQREQTTTNHFEQYGEPDIERLAVGVGVIPNDDADWETWNVVGMAIYRASGGSADGLRIFHEFSSRSAKYDAANTDAKWKRFKTSPPKQIGVGSIFFWANQADPQWRQRYEDEQWQILAQQMKQAKR